MLTSGGEPLQLTNDEGDKFVDNFSPDGKEIYYGRSSRRRRDLGGAYARWGSSSCGICALCSFPPRMARLFIMRSLIAPGFFARENSGLNEELMYNSEDAGLLFFPLLVFPGGNDLLAVGLRSWGSPNFRFYRINLTSHEAVDLGEISGHANPASCGPNQEKPCCSAGR